MSRTERPLTTRLAPLAGLAAVLSLFAAFYPRNASVAWGALCGGLAAVVATLLLQYRRDGGSLGRGVRGEADERDNAVSTHSLAVVGLASFFGCAGAMVAVVWGANPLAVLGVLTWLLLAVAVAAHMFFQRRF